MRCLVCDHEIRIDSLRQLFALKPLRLCSRCAVNLVPSAEANTLFERNEWLEAVIAKLNQGDLVLVELFKAELVRKLKSTKWRKHRIEIEQPVHDLPFFWLEILVTAVEKEIKIAVPIDATAVLVVTVEQGESDEKDKIAIF